MTPFRSTQLVLALGVLVAAPVAARAGGQQSPPMPKPGPEHAVLKMDVGTWDAVVEVATEPGKPPAKSKGVEVNTMGCGGLCLITDFKGEMAGAPFLGHGITTWDAVKKKYVGSWTDSMSTGLAIGESTYDPSTRTSTGTVEGHDMEGKISKMRSTVVSKGNTRVFTLYGPGPDGKETGVMTITYTRRK